MAGLSRDSFERAKTRFERNLPSALAGQFSLPCTLSEVRDVVRRIQQEHGRDGKLRNMKRLGAFLEAMDQFGKVIEVFLNANELLCFVWVSFGNRDPLSGLGHSC
jgi:hypothetical protein